ncbi:hypothetical protein TNCV_4378721 [Trichonephila clavipes]|nr:hypothetical protein TNCV_4378721 [Trichonephila clavipes]
MLTEEWALLPQEMLHQLVLSMRRRCEATIAVCIVRAQMPSSREKTGCQNYLRCWVTAYRARRKLREKPARVIDRKISVLLHNFLEDPAFAKVVVNVTILAVNSVAKNYSNLALSSRFRQVLIESPL